MAPSRPSLPHMMSGTILAPSKHIAGRQDKGLYSGLAQILKGDQEMVVYLPQVRAGRDYNGSIFSRTKTKPEAMAKRKPLLIYPLMEVYKWGIMNPPQSRDHDTICGTLCGSSISATA